MTNTFEVGKTYLDSQGTPVTIVSRADYGNYPLRANNGRCYTAAGTYWYRSKSELDLKAEVAPQVPRTGNWRVGLLDSNDNIEFWEGTELYRGTLCLEGSGRLLQPKHVYLFRVWSTPEGWYAELVDGLGDDVAARLWRLLGDNP